MSTGRTSATRGLMAEMKLKEKRLEKRSQDTDRERRADGDSIALSDGQILTKTTEIQYLKHVLYQYMMGKEPKTMAKVIAAVVKFSPDQTKDILAKEEAKQAKMKCCSPKFCCLLSFPFAKSPSLI
ncbi:hypothetical protein BSL78_21732 [Apostichopus japonicus]|uniref:GRIP domain-containing protein n=1 Tax=Stichopus japonicus TaxID=307972 RepID=A0A2G8K073_STIJA|nr:hypothetical protein BSL78_21732 [Apostichopus japonicus]